MVTHKPKLNHYNSAAKIVARDELIKFTRLHRQTVDRAITMPAIRGYCAQQFKQAFGCHIVGIDRSSDLIRATELMGDTGLPVIVDEYYQGNVFDLALTTPPLLGVKVGGPVATGEIANKIEYETGINLGKFDLMFLDFTSPINDKNVDRARAIMTHYLSNNGVSGITFTYRSMAPSKLLMLEARLVAGYRVSHIHRYGNAKSNVLLAMVAL